MRKALAVVGMFLAGAFVASAQVAPPACGATDRHFDPAEVPSVPVPAGAKVYFVDGATGLDTNTGLTEVAAFKTITKGTSLGGPGVVVRIKAGIYHEGVYITKSGTQASRFLVGAYGNGPVVIDVSQQVTWTAGSSGATVWQAPVPSWGAVAIVVDGVPLRMELSVAAVTPGSFASVGGTLYVWMPDGAGPSSHDVVVVGDYDVKETTAVYLNPSSYLTLYGLTIRGASKNNLNIWGTNVHVEKCRVLYAGKNGISIFNYSTTASTDAELVKNEIAWNMMKNWPRGRSPWAVAGGSWGMGAVANGTARPIFQGNYSHNNGGEGMGAYNVGASGAIFRDNVVGDNWSVNIYVDNVTNVLAEGNYLYSHKPNVADAYNAQVPAPTAQGYRILERLRPECIMTADEKGSASDGLAHLTDITIRNNVMVGCRDGYLHSPDAPGSGMKNVSLLGNTIVLPQSVEATDKPDGTQSLYGINLRSGANSGTIMSNNIVYGFGVPQTILLSSTIPAGVSLSNNLWFGGPGAPGSPGDKAADPLFYVPIDIGTPLTKRLSTGSPAIDGGIAIPGDDLDYQFCPRAVGSRPDLGAFEMAAAVLPTPTPTPPPPPTTTTTTMPAPSPSPTPTPCPVPSPCPSCPTPSPCPTPPDPQTFSFTRTFTCTWNGAKQGFDCVP